MGMNQINRWYRIDLVAGGTRFIETTLDLNDFCNAVSDGKCIAILRHVMGIPIQGKTQTDISMTFATMDKISPLVAASHSDKEHFSLRHVLMFGVVDLDSDLWKVVKEAALKEIVIAIPEKGLVV